MSTRRLKNEQSFHDNRFEGSDRARSSARKFYSINNHSADRYAQIIAAHCNGKTLLEYGCGTGSGSEKWLNYGAILTGIDISPAGIKKAQERLADTAYEADYLVMNAENMDFPDNSFDVVAGTGIIHHLDLVNSYKELRRVLKPEGHAVFIEPLGHNPIINLYRTITPKMRTDDEHPLKMKDIKLLRQYFKFTEIEYFSLFTLMAVPFRNNRYFREINIFLRGLDKLFFSLPFVSRFAWTVVIHVSNPK